MPTSLPSSGGAATRQAARPAAARRSAIRVLAWREADVRRVAYAPAAALAVALLVLLAGLAFGGGATPLVVADPGPVVMWGVPVLRLAFNIAAAVTLGALVTALWIASREEPEFERVMAIAQGAAAAWFVIAVATALFVFLQISNLAFSPSPEFGRQLWSFFTRFEVGRSWLLLLAMLLVLSVAVAASRAPWPLAISTALALLALWPLASQGHAAGAANHELAFSSMILHLSGAAVWLGGLIVISMLAPGLGAERRLRLLERYSTLALLSFITVSFSGLVAAVVNLGSWAGLASPYGLLVVAKTVALAGLGVFGALQRRALIGRMRRGTGKAPLAWLIGLELLLMGAAAGLAAALGRTPSVVPDTPVSEQGGITPAQILAGRELPPEFEPIRLLTEWRLDPLWTLLIALGVYFYLAGVRRLHRRGDAWPWTRTVSFLLGALTLAYLVNGALVVYGTFLFSFHMTEHMVLSMLVPIFFTLAAPVTLLLRAVRPRHDGSLGTREWVLRFVHSRWAAFFSHPIVAAINFATALLAFYYTPLFRWAVTDHVGHMWMIVHFLITGYLFTQSLIGIDPGANRVGFPLRLLSLVLVMTFHAFFGLSIMTGTGLLMADWYGATGRDWGPDAITDQQIGGAIAWGIGEFPTVILALLVTVAWWRSDAREQRRGDRQAARDGDAELAAYNARLRRLAELDAGAAAGGERVPDSGSDR